MHFFHSESPHNPHPMMRIYTIYNVKIMSENIQQKQFQDPWVSCENLVRIP